MKRLRKSVKYFGFVTLLALIASMILPANAQTIGVTLDGAPLHFGDVPPARIDGRVLVPLRDVFVALGAQVDYQAESRTVLAQRGSTNLRLQIGSKTAYVDGNPVTLDVPAQAVLGRTLVPLRFVSEALGAQVAWQGESNTVAINTPKAAEPEGKTQTVSGNVVKIDATAPATITVESGSVTRTYQVASGATIERQPQLTDGSTGKTSAITLAQLSSGTSVSLTIDSNNNVFKVLSKPTMIASKVRNVNGNVITLEDEGSTQIAIGNDIPYINKNGSRSSTVDVKAGDQVALFISGSTRLIYQVSGLSDDVRMAGGTTLPYNPPSNNDLPQINLVEQNATNPVKTGGEIKVTVHGTPGLKGTFDISQQVTNRPLSETQSGVYSGTYTVREGDDVLDGHIAAHLNSSNGYTITKQSEKSFTIDTKAPIIVGTVPNNGATVDVANPNIIIYTDDQGGSGLAPTKIKVTNNGQTYEVDATVAPPQSIRAVIPHELKGKTDIEADVVDNAGNATKVTFSFDVATDVGPIKSINHNATRALSAGDTLTVEMTAPAGGRASFDLAREDNTSSVVAQGIPLIEVESGRYRGSYNVTGTRDEGNLIVVGRYRDKSDKLTIKNATTPVSVVSKQVLSAPTITSPQNDSKVNSPLTISGRAGANNTVHVNVRATGVQYYILQYNQDLGTVDVTADRRGNWRTQAIELPSPKGVSGLQIVVTVTQEDSAGRESEETIITVHP